LLKLRGVREGGLALLSAGAVLLIAALWEERPVLRDLETASLDLRFRLRGPIAPGPETTLILVDDKSLAELGRWPFSRRLLARAVRTLDRSGARTVVFDLLLAEPEQPISETMRNLARDAAARVGRSNPADEALATGLDSIADDDPDADLAEALSESGRVLLPYALTFQGPSSAMPKDLSTLAYQRLERSPDVPIFPLRPTGVVAPLRRFAATAAGQGHVYIAFDRDGAPRYEYVALPYEADFYPSMAIRAAAHFLGVDWPEVGLALGRGVDIGPIAVPTDRAMRTLVNYRGPRGTFRTFSFADLIEGRIPETALRDRLILVGAAAIGINDTFRSPFGSAPLPGVERMANIIDMLLRRDFIERPDWTGPGETLIVLILAALVGVTSAVLRTRGAALVGLLPLAIWAAASLVAFRHGLWISLVAPEAALTVAMVAVLGFRYWIVERDGREIKTAFRHYLAPELVNVLAAHPEKLRLGGETRPMTILFCDIRNFTRMSEGMAPEALVQVMNRFLTPMTEAVMQHRGTVDKYIGDCVMAFWNAPLDDSDHANHACDAALAMLAEVDRLGRELEASVGIPRLAVGIGINTGSCLVGNLGSAQRFDYSVIGDTVNVASRLEALTKVYGVPLLAGDETRARSPDRPWLAVDIVGVRGRSAPVGVHTLWRGPMDHYRQLAEYHDGIVAARRDQRADERSRLIEAARELAGGEFGQLYRELDQQRDRRATV